MHIPPTARSLLPQVLGRAGRLPAKHVEDGERLVAGQIYVAPPNEHVLVRDGHLILDAGPKLNGHRPAVDVLFRSAAETHGMHVGGVVLSGALDDGTMGLLAVKRAGGATFVQDPEEALYRGMPESAIEVVEPEHVASAAEIGRLLAEAAAAPRPDHLRDVSEGAAADPQPGESNGLTCPECQSAIWLETDGGTATFRCRVGHGYTEDSFTVADAARVETALWTSLRALEERAALHRQLSARAKARGHYVRAAGHDRSAADAVEHAVVVRELLSSFVRRADDEVA
jgi:two-component system chemotaxis response regulator CheB